MHTVGERASAFPLALPYLCDVASIGCSCCCEEYVEFVGLLVGYLASQQHSSVSQGRICKDSFTCCHAEVEVADQTFYLT